MEATLDPVLVCRLPGGGRPGKIRRCTSCEVEVLLSPDREPFLKGRSDARLVCLACVPRDAELLGPGRRSFSLEALEAKTGVDVSRLNGALGSSRDLRSEDGAVPPSELGGSCKRCGRSFLRRAGSEGLCRDCSSATSRPADGPPARRPEAGGGGSTEASLPTCSVEDCLRAPSAFGKCRTHLDEERASRPPKPRPAQPTPAAVEPIAEEIKPGIDPDHSWNKWVEKKAEEGVVAVAETETKTCGAQGCFSDEFKRGFCSAHYQRVLRAVNKKHGSWDDATFVARALAGEFAGGPKPAPKKEAPVAEKPKKPAAKPRKATPPPVAHRDTKPDNGVTVVSSPAPVAGEDLPADVSMMLQLAELEPVVRTRVLAWAQRRWG